MSDDIADLEIGALRQTKSKGGCAEGGRDVTRRVSTRAGKWGRLLRFRECPKAEGEVTGAGLERDEEATLRRMLLVTGCVLALSVGSRAEEISLKDGTKIVGHMVAINGDKIEVETSYGKLQLNRSDILTISFPENGAPRSSDSTKPSEGVIGSVTAPPKEVAPKVEESLTGTAYVNKTGKFTLTLPAGWAINKDSQRGANTWAMLRTPDNTQFALVTREEYPGSLESYKELMFLNSRRNLSNFEQISEQKVTIDGQPALILIYRGNVTTGSHLPIEYLTAVVQNGTTFTKIVTWAVEPLFQDMQGKFETIVNSYHSTAGKN